MSEHPHRRAADHCPGCERIWDECKCPELVREAGGVVRAEPTPGPVLFDDMPWDDED